jgi:hypothetical protein
MLQGQCTQTLCFEALQSNNQRVYCLKVLDLQDNINCITLLQPKAPSGEGNVSQTTTLPELKAPPEANMSQNEISANMNPQIILDEPPVQDEDVNLRGGPDQDQSTVCPAFQLMPKTSTMDYCLHLHAPHVLMRTSISPCLKKSVPTYWRMYTLIALESKLFFSFGYDAS